MKTTRKLLFYFLSFTWGLPVTLAGLIVSLALIISGKKPARWNYCWYFKIGDVGGGFSLGPFFFVCDRMDERGMNHEHGHSIQNCWFGPLMPFLVSIPSLIRYWYRELRYYKRGKEPTVQYDAIWFEGMATKLGTRLNSILTRGGEEKK